MQLESDQFADIVATAIKLAIQPLVARIAVLERREAVPGPEGKPGRDGETVVGPKGEMGLTGPKGDQGEPGKDADEAVISALQSEVKALRIELETKAVGLDEAMVKVLVASEVAAIPQPQNGKDGEPGEQGPAGKDADMDVVSELVKGAVADAVKAFPVPQNGQDGASVTLEDVAPLISSEVQKAVSALPAPKDGVGVAGAVIDREGRLVLTLSDGSTKDLGVVVGRDVDQAEVYRRILEEVAKIPRPKDGVDGFGFDEMEPAYDEHGRMLLRFVRGDRVKEFRVPGIVDRGVYKAGEVYLKGDGATWGGSFFIAQQDTSDKPETSSAWRLAVKHGREGKQGLQGKNGLDGKPGRDGKDLTSLGFDGRKW